jgi:hypothetical protein
MQRPAYDPNFLYDPQHPSNIADRANDPADGIDYDDIICATEADSRARRGQILKTTREIDHWLDEICERVLQRRVRDRAAS